MPAALPKTSEQVFAPISTDGEYGGKAVNSSQGQPGHDKGFHLMPAGPRSLGDDEGVELFREVLQIDPLNDAALFELERSILNMVNWMMPGMLRLAGRTRILQYLLSGNPWKCTAIPGTVPGGHRVGSSNS